jgi:hypothetical protein
MQAARLTFYLATDEAFQLIMARVLAKATLATVSVFTPATIIKPLLTLAEKLDAAADMAPFVSMFPRPTTPTTPILGARKPHTDMVTLTAAVIQKIDMLSAQIEALGVKRSVSRRATITALYVWADTLDPFPELDVSKAEA